MKKINDIMALASLFIKAQNAFCNIAEGTHAGSLSMIAGENIDANNRLVKASETEGEVKIAGATDKPIGVCVDEANQGEHVAVALPGCAESTFICVAANNVTSGNALYSAAAGKVTTTPTDGCFKIGVALTSASAGSIVEVDPQGFGQRAWQICGAGIYSWEGSATSATMAAAAFTDADIVVASIHSAAASEKSVKAVASSNGITFTLDAAGTPENTKISWIAIRKN